MALKDDLKAKIVERFGVSVDEIKEDTNFVEHLNADSLDVMDFIMDIEQEYDIKIPATEAESLKTFGDLSQYLAEKTGKPLN